MDNWGNECFGIENHLNVDKSVNISTIYVIYIQIRELSDKCDFDADM